MSTRNYTLTISGRVNPDTVDNAKVFTANCHQLLIAGHEPLGGPVILPGSTPGDFVFFQAWTSPQDAPE